MLTASVFSPKLVLSINTSMKILNSSPISSFGGINFVLEELSHLGIEQLLIKSLPELPTQSKYSWRDIIFSYWSILFCGGDCAEDISTNLNHAFKNNPLIKAPSPDRLLNRLKELAEPSQHFKKNRSDVFNEFSINNTLNELNIKILKKLSAFKEKEITLDYDNTIVYTNKIDAERTYKKACGYCPGVGIIGNNIVYVENRNGNCAPHTLQDETLERMFQLLESENIHVDVFRADSASYQFSTITTINKYVNKLFIKAKMNVVVSDAINTITDWKEIKSEGKTLYRGSTCFMPFKQAARKAKQAELLREYRLVVTKEARDDGQLNLFTGEAYVYSPIITTDFEKSNDEVVFFYNQRGKQEREFDILKNDFVWNRMPFSKLEQNTVFFITMAIARNLYNYLIQKFSKNYKALSPKFRLKKFIFRFICIPAKWIKSARHYKLKIYGQLAFKT